jgi:ATP-dependent Clp protease, protease subunit
VKKISIRGPIIPSNHQWIYDWFGMEATSPKKVSDQLAAANNEDIEVEINSGGGSVFDASEIFTALKEYPGHSTGKILGIAASAASVAAMGVDELWMTPTGQIMIHNAKSTNEGDYRDMDHMSGVLKNVNLTISNAYRLKTGKAYEDLLSMMDAETWLTPQQALEHNLIDKIMFDDEAKLVASIDNSQMLPQTVIDKIRNELFQNGLIKPLVENSADLSNKKGESNVLTLEQLKNEHPDLYNQVLNEGREAGVQAERQRIKSIDELALPGNEELVNKAMFETGISAEQLAVEIIKAEKQRGSNFLAARQEDATTLTQVDGSAAPQNNENEEQERQDVVSNMVSGAKKMRGAE